MTEKEEEKEDNHKERKERDNREEPSKERKQFPRFVGTLPSAEYLQSSQLVPATWEKMIVLKMNTPQSLSQRTHLSLHCLNNRVWSPLHLGV